MRTAFEKLVGVVEDVAVLEEKLETAERELKRLRNPGKMALLIRRDGSIHTTAPYAEPDPHRASGYRAAHRYKQEVIRQGWGMVTYREEFRMIAETDRYYVYEEI